MKFQLANSERLYCRAIADSPEDDTPVSREECIEFMAEAGAYQWACENEVTPHLAHRLVNSLGTDRVADCWQQDHDMWSARINGFMDELDEVGERFADAGISLVALKNSGIARGIYPCRGCCPMGDIDVLVDKKDFRRAHAIMLADGFHFEFRSPLEEACLQAAESGGGAEYWKILPDGYKLWFELQWRPVAGRWLRPDQEPSATDLLARSVAIPGTKVRLLAPEDNLLQVCLHTAKHSYVRAPGFRLHTDVDRIVRRQHIDWELFQKRVVDSRVKTAVYFSLAIPRAVFGAPIPDDVLAALRPNRLKRAFIGHWLRKAGLFNPQERKFGRVGYIAFTGSLYDDLSGLWRGIFPARAWMREQYNIRHSLLIPFYYLRRLRELAFSRAST